MKQSIRMHCHLLAIVPLHGSIRDSIPAKTHRFSAKRAGYVCFGMHAVIRLLQKRRDGRCATETTCLLDATDASVYGVGSVLIKGLPFLQYGVIHSRGDATRRRRGSADRKESKL
jgi:hypothetical protein